MNTAPNIIVLTLDHLYANKVIKDLIESYPNNISLIVDSDVIVPKKSNLAGFLKYLKISGAYYVFAQSVKLLTCKLLSKTYPLIFPTRTKGKFYPFKKMAKKRGIKVVKIKEINDPMVQKILIANKPDLFVSVFFNQLLKPDTINIAKFGAINIHPAYLPDYKGMSPVFWALANGEKQTGVSIHQIDGKIDTGKIIARLKIKIENGENEDSLYWKCVKAGSPLLVSAIDSIFNKTVKYSQNSGGRYFSFPTRQAVANLKKHGSGFFEVFHYLFKN
jgi:methionyl-tRNA formyltransferase